MEFGDVQPIIIGKIHLFKKINAISAIVIVPRAKTLTGNQSTVASFISEMFFQSFFMLPRWARRNVLGQSILIPVVLSPGLLIVAPLLNFERKELSAPRAASLIKPMHRNYPGIHWSM